MNNKTLILLIVVIAAITVVVVSWRTPSNSTTTPTPTPTVTATATPTATPTVTDPFNATPTVTITATPTPTVTTTVTPTPTVASGSFEEMRNSAWFYGVTEQTVSGKVYFIDATDKKLIKKGTSTTDVAAQTVFTSDTAGEVASFAVNGSYLYVATKRDAALNTSKLQRVTLSNGTKAKIYEFYSAKYEITQFSVTTNNDTKAGFYLGLKGVADKAEPAGMYVKTYTQQWLKTFIGVDKTAAIEKLAPHTDGTQLVGSFLKSSSSSTLAYVDL